MPTRLAIETGLPITYEPFTKPTIKTQQKNTDKLWFRPLQSLVARSRQPRD